MTSDENSFTNEDDEQFLRTGRELTDLLFDHGLTTTGTLLDIGCGYGRLSVGLLIDGRFRGRYHGFDVLKRHVLWCQKELTRYSSAYTFSHLDIRNDRYNPKGSIEPDEVNFPAKDSSMTTAALFSVFTHFYREDIERYLAELSRVLKPGGHAVTTWLFFDEQRLPLMKADACTYPMRHQLNEYTLCSDSENPLRAIAYDESTVHGWVKEAGLVISTRKRGRWAGEPADNFQDLLVLQKPIDISEGVSQRWRLSARR